MPEVHEEESERFDFQRYLDIAQRRHLHFLLPLLIGWVAVWGSSWFLQARYKSSTLILVEQPTVPKNYVVPNVSDDLQDRLQSMQQQILSRTRLLMIIDSMQLYSGGGRPMTDDDKVAQMRKEIEIELVRDPQTAGITSFKIDYSAHDPHVAQRVTGELANLFINQNQQLVLKQSGDTTKFLEAQLEAARATLAVQEAKVKAFEAGHQGALPEQEPANLAILAGLQQQLQDEQDALNNATQQRAYYQTLIEQTRALRTGPKAVETESPEVTAVDRQLEKLRAQLADLSSRYTQSYPEVQDVKDEIARTEKEREQLIATERAKPAQAKGSTPEETASTLQVEGQIQANQVEIKNREQAIEELKARISDYQGRLNAEPSSKQQLDDLNRGYEQSQANYNDLLKKRDESEMATSMEEMQQGEHFKILDPPSLPVKPDFPNRVKFCGIGLATGIALGLLVVVGFELADDRLHSESDIKNLLPAPVICEVPEVINAVDEEDVRKKTILGWAMTATVVVVILVGSVVSFIHG